MHDALLHATLQRIRYRLAHTTGCPNDRRSSLILSTANLYQDIGHWTRAQRLYDQILRTPLSPHTEAAALRRLTIGQLFTGSNDRLIGENFRRIAEYKTGVDFRISVTIAEGWWQLSRGRPEECLQLLERFDFDDEGEASSYSPHVALELKLTQAAALDALGLSCRPQVDLVRRLAARRPRTRLRPVFTDQLAPKLLAPQLAALIESLSSAMVATPALLTELDATATALLVTGDGRISRRE